MKRPVRRENGPIEHWVGIATDLEARSRRESLLDAVESPDSPFARPMHGSWPAAAPRW